MVRNRFMRATAVACALALTAAACGGDDDESAEATATAEESSAAESSEPAATTAAPEESSAEPAATTAAPEESSAEPAATTAAPEESGLPAGLWDDGPCDASLPTLKIGLQTVFASGVLTLGDQAFALEASAAAFNERGGANGACIEVITCDDGADPNKAVECVRTLDEAGIVATVNDTTPVAGADVAAAYAAAGIPRFAISPGQDDYPDLNSYPFTAGGTGVSIMMPQALLDAGVTKVAVVRVDIPSATALAGFYQAVFTDNGLEVVADLPVPAGTTDYSQFILAAQAAGAEGIAMPIGGQEGIQVLRAGQQLDADLLYSSSTRHVPAVRHPQPRRVRRARHPQRGLPARRRRQPGDQPDRRRPRGELRRGPAAAAEPEGQPDAFLDRAVRTAPDPPRRRRHRVHP